MVSDLVCLQSSEAFKVPNNLIHSFEWKTQNRLCPVLFITQDSYPELMSLVEKSEVRLYSVYIEKLIVGFIARNKCRNNLFISEVNYA